MNADKALRAFFSFKKNLHSGLLPACFLAIMGLLTGCGSKTDSTIAINGVSTLYIVDTESNTVLWSKSYDGTYRMRCVSDGDTVYLGTEDGILHALSMESGEELWQTQASHNFDFRGDMDIVDGVLYYTAIYSRETGNWPVCSLDLETMEEIPLSTGTTTMGNFSIYQGQLYTCTESGVSVYDMTTGETVTWDLPDPICQYRAVWNDIYVAGYSSGRMEWYTIDESGLTRYRTLNYDELSMPGKVREGTEVIEANDEAAVLLEQCEMSDEDTGFYVYLTETEELVSYDRVSAWAWPSYIYFADHGFYALWQDELRYYDYNGSWEILASGS